MTEISCPGKVLLTGGYLVLCGFDSVVLSVGSHFVTRIIETSSTQQSLDNITIHSPQFTNSLYNYSPQIPTNKYVDTTLFWTCEFIRHIHPKTPKFNIQIIINGDNDFYSQRQYLQSLGLSPTKKNLLDLSRFNHLNCDISQVHKTGLGSSAAMITSIVAALLVHYKISNPDTKLGKLWIHNLAQFCHSLAQGKIGSGFDVSSAVYGTHQYRRFSPQLMQPYLQKADDKTLTPTELFHLITEIEWDNQILEFTLPHGINILMGDIDSGSSTPKMVSKVLEWKSLFPTECDELWQSLNTQNSIITLKFHELNELYAKIPVVYESALKKCSLLKASEWKNIDCELQELDIVSALVQIHDSFLKVRSFLRAMTEMTKVPIEPKEQTKLLDLCMQEPGVLLAGVPGAGGHDAILCLTIGNESRQNLENRWSSLEKEFNICPMLSQIFNHGIQNQSQI